MLTIENENYPFDKPNVNVKYSGLEEGTPYALIAGKIENGEILTLGEVREIFPTAQQGTKFIDYVLEGRFFKSFNIPLYFELYKKNDKATILFYDWRLRNNPDFITKLSEARTLPITSEMEPRLTARIERQLNPTFGRRISMNI